MRAKYDGGCDDLGGGVKGVTRRSLGGRATLAVALGWLSGCGTIEEISLSFWELTPHEAYVVSLGAAGLAETALSRAWIAAAELALTEVPNVSLPFQEEGYFFPDTPEARSYRVSLRRGQELSVSISLTEEGTTRLFVDIYRRRGDRSAVPVLSTDSTHTDILYIASREGDYVVRLQPELLRGGQYNVTLRADGSMSFPVEGHSTNAIQSRFGVGRDGGRRRHHGVDIFSRRKTPVLSATDGVVSRVELTNLGGKVVWVRDADQSQSIYYAHLDSQLVSRGARLKKGDPVGLVGNTGNARTTPPHLHFGVYRRGEGPIDPYYFLYREPQALSELTADVSEIGKWARTTEAEIRLRSAPTRRAGVIDKLPEHTTLRVLAGTGSWYRVLLPNGQSGYIAARLTESMDEPLRTQRLAATQPIQARPTVGAPWVRDVESGTDVDVLGRFRGFLLVQASGERPGWMRALPAAASDR